ncbi:unnamed protein product [Sphagnum compactum]
MVVEAVTSEESFDQYLKTKPLVVVDFYATWCGPCRMVSPRIETISASNSSILFLKVDTDKLESLAGRYGISALPTFVFFKDGKKVDEVVGADVSLVTSKISSFSK